MLFAIPSYFCVYSLPPSHVFHIVFFFLENLNTEVLHLIGLILVVPIQGFIFCYSVLLFKGLADLTSPDLQVTIIYELSCIYSFASCSWTLYKLLVIRIQNCTRLFHYRMLYSTYVFTSFLLEVKVIFNLTYAKSCFACQSYIRLKVYFFKTAVTSDYNSNTLTI